MNHPVGEEVKCPFPPPLNGMRIRADGSSRQPPPSGARVSGGYDALWQSVQVASVRPWWSAGRPVGAAPPTLWQTVHCSLP